MPSPINAQAAADRVNRHRLGSGVGELGGDVSQVIAGRRPAFHTPLIYKPEDHSVPRYFFDFRDGDQATPDVDGTELETRQKARAAATKVLPEIAKDALPDGKDRRSEVTVREDRAIIYRANLVFHGEWLI